MMSFVRQQKKLGRQAFMDPLNPIKAAADKGVPCGGIGGGGITRGAETVSSSSSVSKARG
jgi:hypothetical protein